MTNATWQLQEAKNKFSQVVEDTLKHGPQIITRRGKNTVVVINYQEYQRKNKPQKDFKDVLMQFRGLDFPEIMRERDTVGRATPFNLDEEFVEDLEKESREKTV